MPTSSDPKQKRFLHAKDKNKNPLPSLRLPKDFIATPSKYKHGGKVRRTGIAQVEKGERVLTKRQEAKRSKSKSTR